MKLAFPPLINSIRNMQEARDFISFWTCSNSRLPTILSLIGILPDNAIYSILGKEWCGFDNVSVNLPALRPFLMRASRKQLDSMMTKNERRALDDLPEIIEIYRGCHEINRDGICWTTERDIAERFHTYDRYSCRGEQPIVLHVKVSKSSVFMKLERDESEIVIADTDGLTMLDCYSLNMPS